MTFEQVHAWCRANGADARGVYRGKGITIRRNDDHLPAALPSLNEIFHWDLQIGDKHYPTSASDMQRLVSGKMTLEGFKGTMRGG